MALLYLSGERERESRALGMYAIIRLVDVGTESQQQSNDRLSILIHGPMQRSMASMIHGIDRYFAAMFERSSVSLSLARSLALNVMTYYFSMSQ